MLGEPNGYNLSALPKNARGGLRVTFVTTTTSATMVRTLRHLTSQLPHDVHGDTPDALLLNVGAWNGYAPDKFDREASAQDVADAADQWAQRAMRRGVRSVMKEDAQKPPTASPSYSQPQLIWSTTLGLRGRSTTFAERVSLLLLNRSSSTPWRLLNRTSVLSRLAGPGTWTGVRWSSKHAPHAVNWLDNQRWLQAALLPADASTDDPKGSAALYAPAGVRAVLSRQCLGLDMPTVRDSFIEAWQHYCSVDLVP